MDKELLSLFAMLAVLALVLVPSVFFGGAYELLTGNAFHGARGGTVTYVDLSLYIESIPNWHGVHGLVLSFWGDPAPLSLNGSAGDISRRDLRTAISSGYVIISNSSSPPSVTSLSAGDVSALDDITGAGDDAASRTFTSQCDFKFNSTTVSSVPCTTMSTVAGANGSYTLYLLQDGGSFMIAAPIQLHMIGFNGEISDYQAMIPQGNETENRTYYIHLMMNYTAAAAEPTQPSTGAGGSGGGGGGGSTGGSSAAISVSRPIKFEGPFQLANNTQFASSVESIWGEAGQSALMEFSRAVKGNFTGTAYLYSSGSTSVFMAVIRYSGEPMGTVAVWNRLPAYFADAGMKANAPGARIYTVNSRERAFVYRHFTKDDEILIVYRTEAPANESLFNDAAFEVYAEELAPALPACDEGVTRCENASVWLCSSGVWIEAVKCEYECHDGRCTTLPEAKPDSVSLLLLFIIWIIVVMIVAVGMMIYRKMRLRAAIRRWS